MKILVVDDHPMVRKGLVLTLSYEDSIESIYEASNVGEAVKFLGTAKPDIAIVDLRLGDEDGLEVVLRAKEKGIKAKFIVLTSSIRREDFERAKALGVDGYVLKEAYTEDVLYAFHTVQRGKKFFDPDLMQYDQKKDSDDQLQELTRRERDVLMELSSGKSNVEIAETLFISEHTVKKHVSNILSKLQLTHRTQAALMAKDAMHL